MSILKVAHMGHPVLREKAKPVERAAIATPSVQQLIDDMIDTMREYHGIGLAAPQVHEGVRIFVAGLDKEGRCPGIVAFACGASAATARRSTWSSRNSRRACSSTRTTT